MSNYVWYASYGSNLLEERFLCYIQGGKPAGAIKTYKGCVDKSLPTASEGLEIPYSLYFAKHAGIWNGGGVAFIHHETTTRERTLARMYRITKAQFYDVVMQENRLPDRPPIELDQVKHLGSVALQNAGWYDLLLYLGEEMDEPIFTFTAKESFRPFVAPHESYLGTIIRGIRQTHGLTDDAMVDYLAQKEGIRNAIAPDALQQLICTP